MRSVMRLPNGHQLLQLNPYETSLQFRNIFVDREYSRYDITLPPHATVFDVGANVGVASLFFLQECSSARIFAYEPATDLFRALAHNLAAAAGDQAVARPYALGGEEGDTTLTVYPQTTAMSGVYADPADEEAVTRVFLRNNGFGDQDIEDLVAGRYEGFTQRCQVTTVSAEVARFGLQRIDLLKVNVEKAEWDVLRGIAEHDWPKIGQIVMQVHDIDGRVRKVVRLLRARGFEVFWRQERLLKGTDIYDLGARRTAPRPDTSAALDARGVIPLPQGPT